MTERSARVLLPYGRTEIPFDYDPARFRVLASGAPEQGELSDAALLEAMEAGIGSPPLSQVVTPRDRVLVVVPDATRASGSALISRLLLQRFTELGLADGRIEFLIGAGTHRAPTDAEIEAIVSPEVRARVVLHCHDAFDESGLVRIGITPRGTPVEINRRLLEVDRTILIGAIGFHYFAGFSGGRKGLLPACASDRSIQANHLLGFDRVTLSKAPGVATAALDGNPVSEDMEDAARLFGPSYLLNSVLDARGRIVALYAGDWFAAHRRGCAEYLADHSVSVATRRDLVIASVGGAPRDQNMIQSHKALEHARVVLADGGDLILLAECADGLGKPDFLDWFVPGGADATARLLVSNYKINGQTAWGIRWKAERYRVQLISSLPDDAVTRMGMTPRASLEDALASCLDRAGYILPQGLATLPILSDVG